MKEYAVDLEHLDAKDVAGKIGMPVNQVFKTLVVRGDKTGVIMACIPGGSVLDLKALAACSSNKKVEMAHLKEVFALTGYIRGGVSPIGAKKRYPVYIDKSAGDWPVIAVSAGIRGCQLLLAPENLVAAQGAAVDNIAKQPNDASGEI